MTERVDGTMSGRLSGSGDSRLTRPEGWRWPGLRPMAALPDLAVELLEKGAPAQRFDSADIVLDLHAGN